MKHLRLLFLIGFISAVLSLSNISVMAQLSSPSSVSIAKWGAHAVTLDNNNLPEISPSGLTLQDNTAFTFGTSTGSAINCVYQSTPTSNPLTSGSQGTAGCTGGRSQLVAQTDAAGQPLIDKAAYRFSGGPVTSIAASPTDWITITGSASKTVRITSITLCGLSTTAGSVVVQIVKRSTADSGGTSSAGTAVPLDSNDAAATAAVAIYTVNPTGLGTSVGAADTFYLNLQATGTAGCASTDYGTRNGQALVLRGTTQQAAINFTGVSLPAGYSLTWRIEETEGAAAD